MRPSAVGGVANKRGRHFMRGTGRHFPSTRPRSDREIHYMATSAKSPNMFGTAPPPAGRYQIKLLPKKPREIHRGGATGFDCFVGIIGDPYDGREVHVEFLTQDPTGRSISIVNRDLDVLQQWLAALGADGPVAGPAELVK